ncbi:hypothetical protein EOL73_01205 [Candidatus Saccharibacteria bacterium]|nr:hypothetical protein [Candidatus Saccharibacteria bacterium]NCU40359.1 hypothetical protein [Candidatus Saccharibacteria bacterium]
MFKKLVSTLPFSPALIGQVGFYANRLKEEEATRRIGLVLTVLAVAVQSLTIISPPTPANASNNSDFINGGVASKSELLEAYEKNTNGYQDLMSYAGITYDELQDSQETTINSRQYDTNNGQWLSWGRSPRFSESQGEASHIVNGVAIFSRPLTQFDSTDWAKKNGSTYNVYKGSSKKIGEFSIIKNCANLVTRKTPVQKHPETVAGSYIKTGIDVTLVKAASNLTQGLQDASKAKALAGDRIQYSLIISNNSESPAIINFSDKLDDVLEYSTIQDNGGGTFNPDSKVLSWPSTLIDPGKKEQRTFVVALRSAIPNTARGISDPTSFDCIMNNTFGNNLQIEVDCQSPKVIEQTITALPKTGAEENFLFSGIIIAIVFFFWARSKQLSNEIRLVRREFSNNSLL